MKNQKATGNKKLTKEDRERLQLFCELADSLADLIGFQCEIAIHSLEDLEHSVIKLVNGHHTGRSLHSPITDLGLRMLRLYETTQECVLKSYFTTSKSGELMKSTSYIIKGNNENVIGLFCVNINLSLSMPDILSSLAPERSQINSKSRAETFNTDPQDVVVQAILQAEQEVNGSPEINLRNRNKAIIQNLYENGVFELKSAVLIVAEHLKLTNHAVYKSIREIKSNATTKVKRKQTTKKATVISN